MSTVHVSLRAPELPISFTYQVEVGVAALVVQSRGRAIVAMLAIRPLKVLLRWALLECLHRALERVSDSLSTQMFGDRVVLFNEFVDRHETSTHSDNQVVILNFHDHLLSEVAVMSSLLALTNSHEQAFHPLF